MHECLYNNELKKKKKKKKSPLTKTSARSKRWWITMKTGVMGVFFFF